MKNPLIRIVAAAAVMAAGSAVAGEQPVRVSTDGLPTHMKQRVEAAARQGPTALRQYLQRTRMIGYNLRLEEVVADSELSGVLAKSSPAPRAQEKVAAR